MKTNQGMEKQPDWESLEQKQARADFRLGESFTHLGRKMVIVDHVMALTPYIVCEYANSNGALMRAEYKPESLRAIMPKD